MTFHSSFFCACLQPKMASDATFPGMPDAYLCVFMRIYACTFFLLHFLLSTLCEVSNFASAFKKVGPQTKKPQRKARPWIYINMKQTKTTTVELHERIEIHARCERTVSISEAPGSFLGEIRTTDWNTGRPTKAPALGASPLRRPLKR